MISEQEKDRQAFGERLRKVRVSRGLSQIDLAEAAEVTRAGVSQWERGESGIEQSRVRALAKRLKVDVAWLQWGKGKAPILKVPTAMRRRPAHSTQLGVSYRVNQPPFEGAVPEMETEIGSAAILERELRVRDWWRLPPGVLATIEADSRKLRVYRVANAAFSQLPRGSYVVIDTKQETPVDNDIFAINNGVGLILKRLTRQPGQSALVGLADESSDVAQSVKLSRLKICGRVVAKFAPI